MNRIKPNPYNYFIQCITDRYFDFDSRARRAEYWYFRLFTLLSYLPILFIFVAGLALENGILAASSIGLTILLTLALIIPSLAVTIRRLHDTGKSGWFYLLVFVPFGGLVLFAFTIQEGDRGENFYGLDPKAPFETEIVDHLEA